MIVTKKINNNVALGLDSTNHEVVIIGKGIGFGEMPYELEDLSKIDRTFYDIDPRYHHLLKEIPDNVFLLITRLLDSVRPKISGTLNPNLAFVLADHINFAIERKHKNMDLNMPYSFELEYEYPELTKISRWFVKNVNERFHVILDKGEITCITMHILNAMEGRQTNSGITESPERITRVIHHVTCIIEEYFQITIDKKSYHYFRFKNHLKFFVQRKEQHEEFIDARNELFQSMKDEYPDIFECVCQINDYLLKEFGERCVSEEQLYLMLHVNQLYSKEDCNRKGITPEQ